MLHVSVTAFAIIDYLSCYCVLSPDRPVLCLLFPSSVQELLLRKEALVLICTINSHFFLWIFKDRAMFYLFLISIA